MMYTTCLLSLVIFSSAASRPLAKGSGARNVDLQQEVTTINSGWSTDVIFEGEFSTSCAEEIRLIESLMSSRNAFMYLNENAECLDVPFTATNSNTSTAVCNSGVNTYGYDCITRFSQTGSLVCTWDMLGMQNSERRVLRMSYCVPTACSRNEQNMLGDTLLERYCVDTFGFTDCERGFATCLGAPSASTRVASLSPAAMLVAVVLTVLSAVN